MARLYGVTGYQTKGGFQGGEVGSKGNCQQSSDCIVVPKGKVNRRCSISPRSFHARMETGCGGLHVLLRAPASSCKGAVDDYNATSYVVGGYTITMQAEKPISTPQPKQVRIDELAVYVVNVVIEKLTAVLEI
ncbi:hypothetical protein ALC62_01084 [Cyphomyrmex costatus]|uniref:Uncharacterized protein n=1 Tax=Cyphomyrmex costatus TaxID=456900 RepID=A0A195D4U9_9HYME|nr:hypothetical protein ALC62_01084 [Cyphomyrmex costatus]